MGHQFGGNHTFNSTQGSCGGGNRASSAAYEPGSGSTIMAYAGICGADDLQPHSDPYFHAKSLEEINNWIASSGGTCAVDTPSDDTAPVIDTASLTDGFTIPMHTPFAMSGSASDSDGDPITYDWEQYDLGPATRLTQGDTGSGPIFRSFDATSGGTRTFPQMASVLGAPLVHGEAWPVTDRDLSFRLTVRDNHDVPGTPQFGATVSANNIQIHVTTSAGPFAVTRPNTAITWGRGETHVVTWDVAGTDVAPVSCSNVAIDLSDDGGATFAFPLAASVPNDGSTLITVPSVGDTSEARVRIACVENIFFDVSDVDFNIAAVGDPDPSGAIAGVSPSGFTFTIDPGDVATDTLTISNSGDAGSTLNYTVAESVDGCASNNDVSWLSASPTSGAVPGAGSAPVTVTIDGTQLGSGGYSASLCVGTDDPAHPQFVVSVDVTVNGSDVDEIFSDGFDAGTTPGQPVQDPSFEATTADGGSNPFWDSSDTNAQADPGATVFYSASNSQIPTRTGDWAIWFGGWQGGAEVQIASQDVTIPAPGPRYLNYWRFLAENPDAPGTLTISIDGTAVQTVDASATAPDSDFAAQSVDISAYADGTAHAIELRYEYDDAASSGADGDIFIDDVTIDASAARTPFGAPARQAAPIPDKRMIR